MGLITGSGRSPRGGNGHPLQYSCLENPMDRGAWQAAFHRITRVGHDWSDLAHMLAYICVCIYMYICMCESPSVMSDSLCPHELYSSWNSPGRNTGVGSLSLFQWIFPTQESNWALLHYRWILYQLSYQESLDICIYIADSLHCTAEANNIIKKLYSKKRKKELDSPSTSLQPFLQTFSTVTGWGSLALFG